MTHLVGYPINIVNLLEDDILYFNGQQWINIQPGTQPTIHPLAAPDNTNRHSPVFDNVPVVIENLQPNQILNLRKHLIFDKIGNEALRDGLRVTGELVFWLWTNGDYGDPTDQIHSSMARFVAQKDPDVIQLVVPVTIQPVPSTAEDNTHSPEVPIAIQPTSSTIIEPI